MVYPNYYARRVTYPASVHRPGFPWGQHRYGYGTGYVHRPYGQASNAGRQYGARRGYASYGNYAHRYAPRYGAAGTRWNWLRRPGYRYGSSPNTYSFNYAQPAAGDASQPQSGGSMPPQWIAWAQSCLAQAVGSWVPQDGNMGRATRLAIRTFQQQQQLPATGMLDGATISALQAACSGQGGAAPVPAAPPPPPPAPAGDDVAAATAAAAGSPAPAAAAPAAPGVPDASAAAPSPDAPSGEFFMGGGRWRRRRRWGSGFNFQSFPQMQDSGDDGEMSMGWGGRGSYRRRWDSGMGSQQSDDDNNFGNMRWPRRRW